MPGFLALIPQLYKAGVGIGQQLDAKYMAQNNPRPEYKTPDELLQAAGISRAAFADPRFAGQSQLEARTGQNLSQALNAAQLRGNGMQQVASIAAAGNQADQDIAAQAAQQQRQDQAEYQNMLKILAQSKDQEWQLNKFAPYSDKYNEIREMKGAGQENLYAALDAAAAVTGRFIDANQGQNVQDLAGTASANQQVTQQQNFSDVLLAKQMQQWSKMAQQGQNAMNSFYNAF